MQTGKWLPTVHSLVKALEMEGFEVTDIRPAAPLQSTSADMENRYGFSHEAMMKISRAIEKDCQGHLSEVFHRTNDGFTAYMKYKILTCLAKCSVRMRLSIPNPIRCFSDRENSPGQP